MEADYDCMTYECDAICFVISCIECLHKNKNIDLLCVLARSLFCWLGVVVVTCSTSSGIVSFASTSWSAHDEWYPLWFVLGEFVLLSLEESKCRIVQNAQDQVQLRFDTAQYCWYPWPRGGSPVDSRDDESWCKKRGCPQILMMRMISPGFDLCCHFGCYIQVNVTYTVFQQCHYSRTSLPRLDGWLAQMSSWLVILWSWSWYDVLWYVIDSGNIYERVYG